MLKRNFLKYAFLFKKKNAFKLLNKYRSNVANRFFLSFSPVSFNLPENVVGISVS